MKRITITINDDVLTKLREKQSKIIKKTLKTCSMSKVFDIELRKSLKI